MNEDDPRITAAMEALRQPLPRHDMLLPAPVLTSMFYDMRRQVQELLRLVQRCVCGCCVDNECECEGAKLRSE